MINKLGYRDSNPEMQESKSCALPFGDTPLNICLYQLLIEFRG